MLTTALFIALALFSSVDVAVTQSAPASVASESEASRVKTSDKQTKATLDFIKG